MRPIHGHPITPFWRDILTDTQSYLDALNIPFTALMGFGFANEKTPAPFCHLLFMIGVPPDSLDFPAAKTAADYVQRTILTQAGFPDIEVAVREWTVSLSGGGPKLPTLDILLDPIAEFRSRDVIDVSYGTPWYDLEPHIHTVFPGYVLYPLVLEK